MHAPPFLLIHPHPTTHPRRSTNHTGHTETPRARNNSSSRSSSSNNKDSSLLWNKEGNPDPHPEGATTQRMMVTSGGATTTTTTDQAQPGPGAPSPTNSSSSSHGSINLADTAAVGALEDGGNPSLSASAGSTGTGPPAMTLDAAMFEIEARFLLNLPEEELASVERLFFQLEQAHWYYEDFLADRYPEALPHFPLEGFTQALFTRSECLQHLQARHEDLVKSFNSYKYAVPVYGCVLLNPRMDKVLLVCNWEGTAWSLPRGKVNEGETAADCAAREVLEETGYDVAGRLREEDAFTMVQNAKRIHMYIVRDVPEDFPFQAQVRKEVSAVQFFPFDALPSQSYHVVRSVAHVKHWMDRQTNQSKRNNNKKNRKGSSSSGAAGKQQQEQRSGSNGRAGKGGGGGGGRAKSVPGRRSGEEAVFADGNNLTTFGVAGSDWDVESMFAANEKLTGRKFTYDGNPQRFGDTVLGQLPPCTAAVKIRSLEEIERGRAASVPTGKVAAAAAGPPPPPPVVYSCAHLEASRKGGKAEETKEAEAVVDEAGGEGGGGGAGLYL